MAVKYSCTKCDKRFVDWGAEKIKSGDGCPDCAGEFLELVGFDASKTTAKKKPTLKRKPRAAAVKARPAAKAKPAKAKPAKAKPAKAKPAKAKPAKAKPDKAEPEADGATDGADGSGEAE